jgi:hypothetical protein
VLALAGIRRLVVQITAMKKGGLVAGNVGAAVHHDLGAINAILAIRGQRIPSTGDALTSPVLACPLFFSPLSPPLFLSLSLYIYIYIHLSLSLSFARSAHHPGDCLSSHG